MSHIKQYTNVNTYTSSNTHTHTHTHTHARTHAHARTRTHTHAHTHRHRHTSYYEIYETYRLRVVVLFVWFGHKILEFVYQCHSLTDFIAGIIIIN